MGRDRRRNMIAAANATKEESEKGGGKSPVRVGQNGSRGVLLK